MIESKKPPKDVSLSDSLAIAPSIPSKRPVKKTNNEKRRKLEKINKLNKLKIENVNIIIVAILGETPIFISNFARNVIIGRKIYLKRNLEAIFKGIN
jgi:hypothetical protein